MTRKTIVAVYDTHQQARDAAEALRNQGFSHDEVSFVAGDPQREYISDEQATAETTGERAGTWAITGGLWGGVAGLVAGIVGMAIPGIGPVVTAGPLGMMLGGLVTGALVGGILGGLTGIGIPEDEAHLYAESVRRGGTLVSVTISEDGVDRATEIMERFDPVDIDERSAIWREQGWSRFDETAEPYTPSAQSTTTSSARPTVGVPAGKSTRPARSRSYSYPDIPPA